MHITHPLSPFVKQSQQASFVWNILTNGFRSIRSAIGMWGTYLLAFLVSGIIWIFLWSLKRRLTKSFSAEVSLNDYKNIRLEYDRLTKIFGESGDVQFPKVKPNVPFFLRGILRLAEDIFDLIRQRKNAIGKSLLYLDSNAPRTDLLQPISEKDIWDSRIKVYDYRF
jgi:hypothetical protein